MELSADSPPAVRYLQRWRGEAGDDLLERFLAECGEVSVAELVVLLFRQREWDRIQVRLGVQRESAGSRGWQSQQSRQFNEVAWWRVRTRVAFVRRASTRPSLRDSRAAPHRAGIQLSGQVCQSGSPQCRPPTRLPPRSPPCYAGSNRRAEQYWDMGRFQANGFPFCGVVAENDLRSCLPGPCIRAIPIDWRA